VFEDQQPKCKKSEERNCFLVLEEELYNLNTDVEQTTLCYTAECDFYGECRPVGKTIPPEYKKHKCMEPKCKKQQDGSWNWEYVETVEKTNCNDDACFKRQCDEERGCVNTSDICKPKSNKCYSFSCDYSNGEASCNSHSLLADTTCIEEHCIRELGEEDEHGNRPVTYRKEVTIKNLDVVCPECDDKNNKCKTPKCGMDPLTGDSWCYYVDVEPPEECSDLCTVCDCDPKTGFIPREKCVSGDNCTIDSCDIDGICAGEKIDCYNEVDMSSFPCFRVECASEQSEKGYKCMKKLLQNAYLDICGECIKEGAQEEESEMSSVPLEDRAEEDLTVATDCTGAPPRPLLTEELAAASIALIILAAILVGAAVAASGVVGTKALLDRAKGAKDQSAHNNPLFESNETEMNNPTFTGEDE